jgi:uncharacterized protein YfbU (UPF0304 family)
MELNKKDRVMLINQYRILAALYKEDEAHYRELIGILESGYEIFYSMIDEWISDDMPIGEGKFVLNILDLYRAIEHLKRSSKNRELADHHYSFFHGFDGNNETEYMGFCRFIIDEQGKYQEQEQYFLKNDHLNSHMPMVDKYKRMLEVSSTVPDIWSMNVEEALKILNA